MELERCRLCAEENSNNYQLNNELIDKINSNLPVKIYKGTICAGCHLQLESTIEFFDLIRSGQVILEELESKCFPKENSIEEIITTPEQEIIQIFYPPTSPVFDNNTSNSEQFTNTTIEKAIISKNNSNINNFNNYTNNNLNPIVKKNEINQRREIKIPVRYKNDQFGDELKKIYAKFNIIDDMDFIDLELENNIELNDKCIGFIENNNRQNIGHIIKVPPDNDLNLNNKKCIRKYQKTYFICDVCKIRLPNELKLLEHRLTHKNVLYECTECQATFDIRDKLFHHQNEFGHNGQGIIENFTDLIQSKSEFSINDTSSKEDLINNSTGTFNCKECDIEFENISECDNHYLLTHGDKYKYYCSICHKCFICKLNLQRHHKIVHADLRPYTCRYCGYNFATKLNVDNHEKSHIYKDYVKKIFTCKLCNKIFDYESSFKRHMLQHENKRPFSCTICLKVFRQKIHLIEHERTHSGIKPFECDKCGEKFTTYSQRRAHKIRLHSLNNIIKKTMKSLCTICGKNLCSKEALRKHIRIHTGEKPYKCNCGHSFSDPSNLRKHKLIHNKIKKTNKTNKQFNYDDILKNIFDKDNNTEQNLIKDVICNNNDSNLVEQIIENNIIEQNNNNNNEVNLVEQILCNNNENILVDQILQTNDNNDLINKSIYINGECNLVCDNNSFLDENFELNLNFLHH